MPALVNDTSLTSRVGDFLNAWEDNSFSEEINPLMKRVRFHLHVKEKRLKWKHHWTFVALIMAINIKIILRLFGQKNLAGKRPWWIWKETQSAKERLWNIKQETICLCYLQEGRNKGRKDGSKEKKRGGVVARQLEKDRITAVRKVSAKTNSPRPHVRVWILSKHSEPSSSPTPSEQPPCLHTPVISPSLATSVTETWVMALI